MKTIIYCFIGIILLSFGPRLILGVVFTAGIYYVLYMLYKAFTSGNSGGSSHSSSGSYDESDPGDGWKGTGNPHV